MHLIDKYYNKYMKSFSLTYTGVAVVIVGYLFKLAGVPFVEAEMQTVISFVTTLVGVITTLYGRWRVGDLKMFGGRKAE